MASITRVKRSKETRRSHLSQSLYDILTDSPSSPLLGYFIQYMESVSALHLVQCWLSVETFKHAEPVCELESGLPSHSGLETYHGATAVHQVCTYCRQGLQGVSCQAPLQGRDRQGTVGDCTLQEAERPTQLPCVGTTQVTMATSQGSAETGCKHSQMEEQVCLKCIHTLTSNHCEPTSTALSQHLSPPEIVQDNKISQQKNFSAVSDAIGIYTTYIALNATSPVGVPDALRQRIEVSICPEDGDVDRQCFDEVQSSVFATMEKRYYPEFLGTPLACRYQLEYIAGGELRLMDFLLGQNTLFYFMEYMEQEQASSLLQFWMTAESFHSHMCSPSRTPDIQADTIDAIAIYDRIDVENKICDEAGPRMDSFSAAQQCAYTTMNENHYPRFLESSIYLQFLDELLRTLQSSESRRGSTVAASEADSAEILSVGCDLDDPDSLWQRLSLQMRLGYVDAFGQYISEAEPCPTKSGKLRAQGSHEGSGKRASWWHRHRVDEELAMKLARAAVGDVLKAVSHYPG